MVFDTMVPAYALLGVTGYRESALAALEKAETIVVPESFFAELANVAWQWVRHREVHPDNAFAVLDDTEALITRSLPTPLLWRHALAFAIEANHPAYDTLFIAAAQQEETRVVTFDSRLVRAFPDHTVQAEDFLRE